MTSSFSTGLNLLIHYLTPGSRYCIMKNRKKINIITLGCSKNVVDSEKLLRQIEAGGYNIAYNESDNTASTVIINTCGFINDAKEESIDTILRYVNEQKSGKIDNLYVMGCLAERYMDALRTEIPEVKKYFGVNHMEDVLNELGIRQNEKLLNERKLTTPEHYAYLKIAEGCDRICSFCAIPAIRGQYISRPVEEILEEASKLAEKGVKELILIAQDLSYYGLDRYKKQMLPSLVNELLRIKNFEWIRLHYLYPSNFPWDLVEVIRDNPRVCRYIDIPVQHITDRMLKSMRRSHNKNETLTILNRLREEIPESVIRTTLIAGHPGETEEDFYELKKFIEDFRFDRLGVFKYSHEEGTYSFREFSDEIPDDIKESRVAELMEIQQNISSELNEKLVGKIFKVLIDRREGEYYTGRTEFDSPEVDQEVLIPATYKLKPGSFYQVLINRSTDFDLIGIPQNI